MLYSDINTHWSLGYGHYNSKFDECVFKKHRSHFRRCFHYPRATRCGGDIDPRATRCGGDIVTLLWFRASVCAWFRPSVDLVNTIETKPLHISLSNLADMLTMMRGWTLLIFEVRGQRSRSQWRYIEISLWRRGDATLCVVIFFINY